MTAIGTLVERHSRYLMLFPLPNGHTAEDGELLRHLTLDPTKTYQPTGRPKGPARS